MLPFSLELLAPLLSTLTMATELRNRLLSILQFLPRSSCLPSCPCLVVLGFMQLVSQVLHLSCEALQLRTQRVCVPLRIH